MMIIIMIIKKWKKKACFQNYILFDALDKDTPDGDNDINDNSADDNDNYDTDDNNDDKLCWYQFW